MLTNEQRAHDLTIATINYLLKNPQGINIDSCVTTTDNKVLVDIFKMYMSIYATTLESINREFHK